MKTKLIVAVLLALGSAPGFSQVAGSQPAQSSPYMVEAVECRGNVRTSCDYIRRKLALSVNARIDDEAVKSARLRLSALPIFESVFLRLEKGSEKGKAILIVEVVEASPYATEFAAGISYNTSELSDGQAANIDSEAWQEQLFGRISNQNLFGRQKIGSLGVTAAYNDTEIDVSAANRPSSTESKSSSVTVNAAYIDPALGGMDRVFLAAGGSYSYSRADNKSFSAFHLTESESRSDHANVGISVGVKFWDYAFALAAYNYSTIKSEVTSKQVYPLPQVQEFESDRQLGVWRLSIGWDSEDDAYFPTRGIRASIFADYTNDLEQFAQPTWAAAYKQTWSQGSAAVWTINIGGEPGGPTDRLRPVQVTAPGGLALTYARSLSSNSTLNEGGEGRRGRWYVQLSTGPVEISRDGHIGGQPTVAAVKVGLRWETKILGVVDLFAMGVHHWVRPNND